jgi:hypothetical protein
VKSGLREEVGEGSEVLGRQAGLIRGGPVRDQDCCSIFSQSIMILNAAMHSAPRLEFMNEIRRGDLRHLAR